MASTATPTFTVRNLALARAALAAIAAIMITFNSDHTAALGLATFSGFAIATSLVWAVAAWLVFGAGQRGVPILLAFVNFAAGLAASVELIRTPVGFFVIIISWAAITGIIELLWGLSMRKAGQREAGRDAITQGAVSLALAVGTALVRVDYSLPYEIEEANLHLELTGVVIAVGLFGGYAAITAVFQAIAGLSPKPQNAADDADEQQDSVTASAGLSGEADQ